MIPKIKNALLAINKLASKHLKSSINLNYKHTNKDG